MRGLSSDARKAGCGPRRNCRLSRGDRILKYVRENGSITSQQCQRLIGVGADRAHYLLKRLTEVARLKPEGRGRWRKYLLP